MESTHDFLRQRLLERVGMGEIPQRAIDAQKKFAMLQLSEWSPQFEQLMRNRLIMGAMRYESMSKKKCGEYNFLEEAHRRLGAYDKTGNKEFLVDAANMCLLEFEFPYRPGAYFDNEEQHNVHASKL